MKFLESEGEVAEPRPVGGREGPAPAHEDKTGEEREGGREGEREGGREGGRREWQ